MKKSLLFLLCLSIVGVSGCNGTNNTSSSTETPLPSESSEQLPEIDFIKREAITNGGLNQHNLANDVQDGVILHAWNWSYKTIKDNIAAIASAGYSAVQTSPVQQSKSTSTTGSWNSSWAMLYQPVSFSIAQTSWLGSKQDLTDLCAEADKYGVKVICDVVLNHMANDNTGKGYSERINEFEPEIYQNKETYFHQYDKSTSDISAKDVTQGKLSDLPDLNTSNEYIQQRAISLLKECVDCGVSGFRFDAAKHIETGDDGAFSSSFWNNLLTTTTNYASTTYDRDVYYYGEILNTPGDGREFTSYTKMMSITDTDVSGTIRQAVNARKVEDVLYGLEYTADKTGKKSVVWVESHDTFADGSTAKLTTKKINRAWAINASRSGATSLYFARPAENTAMGKMGTKTWKNPEVVAMNKFHNEFMNSNESISVQGDYFLNERYDEANNKYGLVVVKVSNKDKSTDVKLVVDNMNDGTYYDQVSGGTFKVENKVLTGQLNDSEVMVLTDKVPVISPVITASVEEGYFYDEAKVTITASNFEELSYEYNGETKQIENKQEIVIASDKDVTIKVKAKNGEAVSTETYNFYKVERKEGYVACAGLMDPTNCEIYAWTWKGSAGGKWAQVEIVGNVAYLKVDDTMDHYLLVSFPKGYKFEQLTSDSWSDKIGQTNDYVIDEDVIETSTI